MSNTILNILQRHGLRLSLCAITLSLGTMAFAQDADEVGEETALKAPKRKVIEDKNPTILVRGIVRDNVSGAPVAGVRVNVLNDQRYVAMTDANGKFTIKVPTFATSLYVQAPKYQSQQVAIRANDTTQEVNVSMLSDVFAPMYDEGTGITAKNSFTASGNGVSIDGEIQSNLGADVRSVMRSGNLDQGAFMQIRGINSLNANTQPLIIIDGVELDMQRGRYSLHQGDFLNVLSTLSPEDIDKVTVLKNATALYGARGANGVILIETKRGHSFATRIDAKISSGVTLMPQLPTMMDANQYRNYAVEQLGTISEVKDYQAKTGKLMNFNFLNDEPTSYYYPTFHNNTNWKDYVYRTAITQNYSINVQGGDDVGMYNLSVGYVNVDKNVKNCSFDRVNVRFNSDINLLSNLSTRFDMSFSRTNNYLYDDGFAEDMTESTVTSPTMLALIKSPLLYPYQYNKNVGGFTSLLYGADDLYEPLGTAYSLANPVALMESGEGDRKNKNENTFFNVAVAPTWNINDNLSATTHFSYYLNRNSQAYYRPNLGVPSFYVEGLGVVWSKVASIFANEQSFTSNTHIDWKNKFAAHEIAVTGGFRFTYFSYDCSDLASQYDNPLPDDKNPSLNVSEYSTIAGANDIWKNMQWYVSADYNYMNRYFLTLSVLAEANSRFGNNLDSGLKAAGLYWGIFPSVQAGWVITNENWFPKMSTINYLRLYAGFDISGNDDIDNYAARTSFSPIRFNGSEIGVQLTNVGNDKIKWETTTKWNVGVQANLLDNRLAVNANYYLHKTKDLLTLKTFSEPISGINRYWTNGGSLKNVGYEVAFSGKPVVSRDWNVEIGASVGHYDNKIEMLPDGNYTASVYGDNNILVSVANPVGLFYGYQTCGIFSSDAEARTAHTNADGSQTYLVMKNSSGLDERFEAGDVHFVDRNGDGVINDDDKAVIGNPNPDLYGNIFAKVSYKRFTLNVGFNYSLNNDVYNYQRSILNSGSTLFNQQVAEINHWRYEGQQASLPKVAYGDPMGNNRFSDRWIEDGSYLRLKTVALTYQIPIPESWQSWLQGISVWGEAHNIFTLTHYTGNDPEFSVGNGQLYQGIDCGYLSQSRSFTLGVKINL